MVKKLIYVLVCILSAVSAFAQNTTSDLDSTTFKGRFDNKEFNIYIVLDAYHNNVIVPRQEVYGEMSGYLGDYQDGRKWLFTASTIKDAKTIELSVINDYGSEDLTATFSFTKDGTYVLRQEKGSNLKIVRNRKWLKLPKEMVFVRNYNRVSH